MAYSALGYRNDGAGRKMGLSPATARTVMRKPPALGLVGLDDHELGVGQEVAGVAAPPVGALPGRPAAWSGTALAGGHPHEAVLGASAPPRARSTGSCRGAEAFSSPDRGTPIWPACLAPARAAPSQSPSVGACLWNRSCQFWTPSGRSSRCWHQARAMVPRVTTRVWAQVERLDHAGALGCGLEPAGGLGDRRRNSSRTWRRKTSSSGPLTTGTFSGGHARPRALARSSSYRLADGLLSRSMGISRKPAGTCNPVELLVPDQDGRYRHQDPRHRLPRPWSPRLRTVLVDWQSLRLSLARGRRRAGPAWVLQALVEEVGRVLPDRPAAGTTVWLFLSPASELRADRVLLESATVADPSVEVRVRCPDGDLIGIELALRAADAWHEHPEGILAVVTDAGRFATVARHWAAGREPPWLLHLHERPPGGRGARGAAGQGQGGGHHQAAAAGPGRAVGRPPLERMGRPGLGAAAPGRQDRR